MTVRIPLLLTLALGVATSLTAQTIDYVVFSKTHEYSQTDWGTTSESTTSPWTFGAYVSGSGITSGSPVTSVSLSAPGTVGAATVNYSASNANWQYEAAPYSTQAELQGAFADGSGYTMTFNSSYTTTALSIDSSLYPNTPELSLTSGSASWYNSGGVYYLLVDPTQDLVLTTNTFSTNFSTGLTRIGWDISGPSYSDDNGAGDLSGNSATITITAGSLIAGNTYDLYVEFNRFSDVTAIAGSGITGLDGAQVLTMLGTATSFQIYAYSPVPEPSTYALLIGVVALGGVVWRRRRRC